MLRVQLLGASRLSRVVLPYFLDQARGRIVGLDPGEEDEGLPWFAPLRGLCRNNGVPLGRFPADVVLDLDPDARPTRGEGPMLRVLPPEGARSPDVNRAILQGGEWEMAFCNAEGTAAWARKALSWRPEDDAERLLSEATLRAVECLSAGMERLGEAPEVLPRPLKAGRWRPAESFLIWEEPAEKVARRIRAASGPWGGARAQAGETVVWLSDARVVTTEKDEQWLPGTLVAVDEGLEIATGRGTIRVERLRPGWRPERAAGDYAREVGLGVGWQLG